jgi:hypothetical protein
MLITGGSPTVIAERVLIKQANQKIAEAVPEWPVELQTILDEDALKKKAAEAAATAAANALGVDPALIQKTPAQIAEETTGGRIAAGITGTVTAASTLAGVAVIPYRQHFQCLWHVVGFVGNAHHQSFIR